MKDVTTPPKWLTGLARSYFRKVAPTLQALGKLDAVSVELVATMAHNYAVYRDAVKTMEEQGRVITTSTGTVKVSPYATVEKAAFESMCRVWKELDLRGKPPVDQRDELDKFLEE